MKKTFFAVALFVAFFAVSAYAVKTTRYWDGCKPSCAWTSNASGSPNGAATACNVSGSKLSDANARNACESGGTAYTCMAQVPWVVSDNLSYGFAASHSNGNCGKCYELSFTSGISGKKMVVMVSNIGGDVGGDQFDLMIPGGGVGQFNALSTQIQQNGGSSSNLGQQYGGFRATCGANESCIRKMCDDAFGSPALADLKRGCYWYIDWFRMADNPNADSREITCPAELVTSYKNGTAGGGGSVTPTPTTYTLTVNRSPTAGGTTTPASSQANISGGTQVNISATPASGYSFTNWTVTTGSGTLANANNASTSVTVNGNVTVQANFRQNTTQYTLTVNRSPSSSAGTVNVNNAAYSSPVTVNGGTAVNISAAAASGYTFTNWTVTTGTAQINNANSASTTVSLSANATITANFTQIPTTPTTYTLTVNRNPSAAGTVMVNNNNYSAPVTVNGGTAVSISATAATGYRFTSWTVSSGTASIASASSATTTVTLTANAAITANFTSTATGGGGGGEKDTIKTEAEDYTSKNGDNIRTGEVEGGGMCIGYIENGNSTTYNNVIAPQAGEYTMQFRIATGQENSSFTVTVNGTNVGTISTNNTGGWDTYITVTLSRKVELSGGDNTVVLNFQNAVNVDYFLLIGDKPVVVEPPPVDPPDPPDPPIAVKYNAAKGAARTQIALRPTARGGFIAALPTSHGFTSYRVIDLQGREIRSGNIDASATDLSVGGLKHSVFFLRLEGKGRTPTALKVVTY